MDMLSSTALADYWSAPEVATNRGHFLESAGCSLAWAPCGLRALVPRSRRRYAHLWAGVHGLGEVAIVKGH